MPSQDDSERYTLERFRGDNSKPLAPYVSKRGSKGSSVLDMQDPRDSDANTDWLAAFGSVPAESAAPASTPSEQVDKIILDGLDMYNRPIDYSDPDAKKRDMAQLAFDGDSMVIGTSSKMSNGDYKNVDPVSPTRWFSDQEPKEVKDEAWWGTGEQDTSKEEVLNADPVEISQAIYDGLTGDQQLMVEFNTLLNNSADNGLLDTLSQGLGYSSENSDQLISSASILGSEVTGNPEFSNPTQTRLLEEAAAKAPGPTPGFGQDLARAESSTEQNSEPGRQAADAVVRMKQFSAWAADTSSSWEFDNASEQIADYFSDLEGAENLKISEVTGEAPSGLSQDQAFNMMFNDIAAADDWTATTLVQLLEGTGYSPDEFWTWASNRIDRFNASDLRDEQIVPGEGTLSADQLAQKLQL